ncbi:MAG TPA: STAS domain-containing protein [Anaerolineales bacterium]|jgi:anti-anti-sigma factor|nr:STAS domain-containing protein [Anaerolineales bacterium]
MEITTTQYNRCDVVKMTGRVDTYTAPKLQETMDAVVESGKNNIVFDMSEVDFLSSKGLWVLTETQKKCKKQRGKLVLVNTDEKIRKSFDLVGMGDYFDIFDDLTAAVGSF